MACNKTGGKNEEAYVFLHDLCFNYRDYKLAPSSLEESQ